MAKPRAAQKKKETAASPFIEALRFVALAQREDGEAYQTHVRLDAITFDGQPRNVAIAYDGTLAAGIFIDEDLQACPHTDLLLAALTKCSGTVAIAQVSREKLTVQDGKFKAFVPCMSREIMPTIYPDPPIAPISNEFIKGLENIAFLATENGTHIVTSSILCRRYSMISTDRHFMLEYWHGIDLPTFALPKSAAIALTKCKKELQWFGYSQVSVTFYFTDGSWLKSQLYDGAWPQVDAILDQRSNPWPVPPNFFDGVRAVAPFNEQGWVTFGKNELRSSHDEGVGATYSVNGVPGGPTFNAKYLLYLEALAKSVDFVADNGKATFFGDNLRGVMIGIIDRKAYADPPSHTQYEPKAHDPNNPPSCGSGHKAVWNGVQFVYPICTDDCIPF